MLSSIFTTVVLLLCVHRTIAVNMCTEGSTASPSTITVNLINGTGVNGCDCSVKFRNPEILGSVEAKIIFEAVQFSGCKYRLVISYNNISTTISCDKTSPFYYDINKTDEIKLYLESTSSQDDTTFSIDITSINTATGGSLLRLDCFLPNTNLSTTTISTTERTTTTLTRDTTSSREVMSTVPLSTARSTEAMITTMDSSTKQDDNNDGSCSTDVVTAGIIGGVIGVVIGGVIGGVLVFIIIRLKKKRTKNSTSEIYSLPSRHQPESQYTDLQLS